MTSVPVRYCLQESPDRYVISDFYGRSILVKVSVLPLYALQCEVPVMKYSLRMFSKTLYILPNSSGLVVPYLKRFVGIVDILRIFLLLDMYHMNIHTYHQEFILPVFLHQKHQYSSIIGGHQVMGKILWSGGTFSCFMLS